MASSISKHDDPVPSKHQVEPHAEAGPKTDPMQATETIAEEQRRRSDEYVAGLTAAAASKHPDAPEAKYVAAQPEKKK